MPIIEHAAFIRFKFKHRVTSQDNIVHGSRVMWVPAGFGQGRQPRAET